MKVSFLSWSIKLGHTPGRVSFIGNAMILLLNSMSAVEYVLHLKVHF